MNKSIISGVLITLVIALSGCASMFGSSNNKSVKVSSNIDEASVYVDGRYYGSTSTGNILIPLDGGANHSITIKKQGYQSITMPVNQSIQGAYYANIPLLFLFIVPGVIGFVVDGTTGNMHKYDSMNFQLSSATGHA